MDRAGFLPFDAHALAHVHAQKHTCTQTLVQKHGQTRIRAHIAYTHAHKRAHGPAHARTHRFSLFAMRDGTDDKWREYRFPFQVEVRRCQGFVQTLQAMKAEVDEAEAELAKDRSPKKAHKSKRGARS